MKGKQAFLECRRQLAYLSERHRFQPASVESTRVTLAIPFRQLLMIDRRKEVRSMKAAAAVLILTTIAPAEPATAISRYESSSKTCASVQQLIASERAAIFRYPSRGGRIVLYDRYVADDGQCGSGDYAARAYVPTKDNPLCPVHNCKSSSIFNPH